MKLQEIIQLIENKLGPYEEFDKENNKLIFGNKKNEIYQIYFCWRLTLRMLKSISLSENILIICHEPLFYKIKPLLTPQPKSIKLDSNEEKLEIIKSSKINIARFHLSLDSSPYGTNKTLIKTLNLVEKESFRYGSICELDSPKKAKKIIKKIKKTLGSAFILTIGDINKKIKRILLVAGGGANKEFLSFALAKKCDAFISGDSHMESQYFALENKILLIDPGHQFLEIPGIKNFSRIIKRELQEIKIKVDFIEDKEAIKFFKIV